MSLVSSNLLWSYPLVFHGCVILLTVMSCPLPSRLNTFASISFLIYVSINSKFSQSVEDFSLFLVLSSRKQRKSASCDLSPYPLYSYVIMYASRYLGIYAKSIPTTANFRAGLQFCFNP